MARKKAPVSTSYHKQPVNPIEDDNSTPKVDDSSPNIWTAAQESISNLLPLTHQDELYSLLLGDAADGSSKTKQVALVNTCQQLFRYIEYLAELQENLKKKEKSKKRDEDGENFILVHCIGLE
jgi:hypothetical protein